jgi:hypothetical protein
MFHRYRFASGSSARIVAAAALTAAFGIPITAPGTAAATGLELSAPILPCEVSTFQALVSSDVTITSASKLATPAPAVSYCQVNGFVETHGPAPTTNHVNFVVALPDAFGGRYYYLGEGGSAGFVPPPTAALLRQGYTFAGSDGGSPSPGVDYSFGWDRTKGFDWGHRGVHVATVTTQLITRKYYGIGNDKHGSQKHDLYRYIDGCSGGGRMGNVEALLYPDDYDGVIAGAPGINTNNILFFGRVAKFLLDNPDAWIPPATINQLSDAILAKFDGSDGALDGLVSDPTKIKVDLESLGIAFTPAQLQTLKLMTRGLNSFGQTYPGYTLSNPIGWSGFIIGLSPPTSWVANPATRPAGYLVFDSASRGLFGPGFDFTTDMDFNNPVQVNAWHSTWEQTFVGSGTADPAGLDRFRREGGKILFWHGVADNGITVTDTLRYYKQLAESQRGYDRTRTFARLFLVPGLNHCGGGLGPSDVAAQALPAITQWVEHGRAPQSLLTHRALPTPRTFLLCPYPEVSVFKGGLNNPAGLDANDAANWTCGKANDEQHD